MQPKFQRKKAPPRQFFCQIKRETSLPPERLPPLFTFPLSRGYAFPPFRRSAAAGESGRIPRSEGGLPGSPGGDKRGRDTKVSLPLLTPQPFLRTRLPAVARLKARGPQGRLLLQGYTLDGSGAFRSGTPPPCTVWPRTVMRGGLRKLTSGPDSVPKSARRTEPSPRTPVSLHISDVSAQRRVWGSQERAREPYGALAPFCLRRQTAAFPAAAGGHSSRPKTGRFSPPAAHRCIGGTACPLLREKEGHSPPCGEISCTARQDLI